MENLEHILGLALVVLYWLFTAAVTLRVVAKRNPVSVTLSWLLVIYILPVFGAVFYLMLGELNLGKQRARRAEAMVHPFMQSIAADFSATKAPINDSSLTHGIYQLLATRMGIGALGYQRMQLLDTPELIFSSLCADVRAATTAIHIETYIWFPGGRVDHLSEELINASKRGVKVSLLIDHASSRPFFRSNWRKRLVDAGIEVVPALPVRLLRALVQRIDLRLHRKLIVIDGQIAYSGSMNIADPLYFKTEAKVGAWVDIMLRLDGPAARGLDKVFAWDWEVETGLRRLEPAPASMPVCDKWLSILPSGPGIGDDLIGQAVLSSIYRANHSITISTPYFVPSEAIFNALCQAAQRGLRVKILLPERNDSKLVGWASRAFYERFLQAGGEIYLFRDGLLHTKAMLMDDQLALVGSVNLDIRSLQLNFELTLALFSADECARIGGVLDGYEAACHRLQLEDWQQRSRAARILERGVFFLSPLL
ncbi:MAG: cardiolipin synthase [Halopseudomonas sp.]|uniref:cardiolipin synthase n=1 Tax=Halopseudomonas sp. TaxID=2901191 RepID=UPI003002F0CE